MIEERGCKTAVVPRTQLYGVTPLGILRLNKVLLLNAFEKTDNKKKS